MAVRTDVSIGDLNAAKKAVAQRVIDIGVQLGASKRDIGIALTTANRESDFKNLLHDSPDGFHSAGVFQQRYDRNGESYGWNSYDDVTNVDKSITQFYLGGRNSKGVLQSNAGLLVGNRDSTNWAEAARITQGYRARSPGDNTPYYREDSANAGVAKAMIANQVPGVKFPDGVPETGGATYGKANTAVVRPRSDGWMPGAPTPTGIPTPAPSSGSTPKSSPAPTLHSERTAASYPYSAASAGGGFNTKNLPGPAAVRAVEAAPGQAALAVGRAANVVAHDIGGAYSTGLGGIRSAASTVAHGVGDVASGAVHAVSHLFDSPSKPQRDVGGGAAINWAHVPDGFRVMDDNIGTFGGSANIRQLEHAGGFLPQQSQQDFANRSLPLNGIVPSPTGAPLKAAGEDMNGLRDAIVKEAHNWLAIDYVFGGKGKDGIDCSGLVQNILNAVGIGDAMDMISADQARLGPAISMDQAHPGDLVAWDNSDRNVGADHIAVYLGNGYIAEAPRTGVKSRIRKLTDAEHGKMWFVDMTKYEGSGGVPPGDMPHEEIRPQAILPVEVVKDVAHLAKKAAAGVGHIVGDEAHALGNVAGDIGHAVGSAGHVVAGDVGSFVHASEQALQHAAGAVGHGAEALGSGIGHIVGDEAHALGNVAGDIAHGIGNAASAYGNRIGGELSDIAHDPIGSLKDVAQAGQFIGTGLYDKALSRLGVAPVLAANAIAKDVVEPALGAAGHAIGDVAGNVAGKIGGLFGGGHDAPPTPVAGFVPGGPEATQQRLAAAQADIGLANRANVIAAAQGVSPAAGDYRGTTNARVLEQQAKAREVADAYANRPTVAFDSGPVARPGPVGPVPDYSQQHASAAQADIGLQNRANTIAAQQAAPVQARPVTNAVQASSTPAGGYQGTTNARQVEQAAAARQATATQLAQQKAAAAAADRGLANRAQAIAATPVAAAPAANVSSGQQGMNMYQAAAQRESAAQADVGLQNRANAIAGAGEHPYVPTGQLSGDQVFNMSDRQMDQYFAAQKQQYAAWAAANPYTAAANARAQAAAVNRDPFASPAASIHIQPISVPTYNSYQAPSRVTSVSSRSSTPVRIGTTGMTSTSSYHPATTAYQANTTAYTAPTHSFTTGYAAPGGYGVSTPSTRAMSTGVDRYADSRDYYYSPAGGGGATYASVGVQQKGWSDAQEAYRADQERQARELAHPSDSRNSYYGM